jgi:Tol biopolymer transport system component/DNA-binding winged helix-turn-helix (wHTH) protein
MTCYRFGPFALDPALRLLLRDEQSVAITTKVFETLVILVENRGRVVTKDELLSTLWPDTIVEEANLAQNISTLRRALDDKPKEHRYIATIPGRGYSFVAVVSEISEQQTNSEVSARNLISPAVPAKDKSHRRWRFRGAIPWFVAVPLICLAAYIFYFRNRSQSPTYYSSEPLTTYVGSEICPSFSPDGERVAFAWDGEKQDNFDIYVKQIGDGLLLRLTSDPRPELSPAWSPDGRTIAFLRLNSDSKAEVLLASSVAAGPARSLATVTAPLTLYPHLRFISWSRDSKWLAVSDSPTFGGVTGLFLLSVETGEKRRITQPPAEYDDFEPTFSPDMRHLAFVRYIGGGATSDLYLQKLSLQLDPQDSAQRLTFYNRHTASPVWTSDGETILFSRIEQPDNQSVWRINLSGDRKGEPVPLSADSCTSLDLSRQGRRLAYSRERVSSNIWGVDLPQRNGGTTRSSSPRLWIGSTLGADTPQFSPDGQRIAYQSGRSGKDEIWVCDRDGSHARQLTHLGAFISGFPRWSPDGKNIVFHSRPQGPARLYIISAEGDIPQRLGDGEDNDYAPSWSHDGKWIYFSSRRTGDLQVWKIPAGGGPKIQVTKRGGWSPLESIDGQYLYYIKLPQYALWRLSLAGGEESQVLPAVAGFGSAYAPGKEGIYFIRRSPQVAGQEVAFFRYATRQITSIVRIPREVDIGLTLSADERLLLYGQTDQVGSDLMLVENFH